MERTNYMNAVLPYVLNTFLILIEGFVLYQLGISFFSSRNDTKTEVIGFFSLCISQILILFLCGQYTVLKYIFLVIIDSLWMYFIFRPHPLKCLTLSILYLSILLVCDSFFLTGFRILFLHDVNSYTQNIYSYYLFAYVVKIVELLLVIILRLLVRNQDGFTFTTWHDWVRIIAFPLMSGMIAIVLMRLYSRYPDAAESVLLCSIILLCADMLAIILLGYIEEQQQKLHDYSILKHDMKLEQDNVTAWMNAYSNQRKQTHEYQHQLEVVRGLAKREGGNDELIQYVSQLLQTDMSEAIFVNTGRTVVDVILNQKHSIAQSKGITLKVQLDDLREFVLNDDAIVVVLSNLLDNAIKATEKNQNPLHKTIVLKMQANPAVNFLYVENYSELPVTIVDNKVLTHKRNIAEHGYGLKNIEAILSQYCSDYVLDYDPETMIFRFSAQILPSED